MTSQQLICYEAHEEKLLCVKIKVSKTQRTVKIGGEQCTAVIIDFAMLPAQTLLAGNGCIVLLYLHLKEIPAESGVWRRKLKINYKYILTF